MNWSNYVNAKIIIEYRKMKCDRSKIDLDAVQGSQNVNICETKQINISYSYCETLRLKLSKREYFFYLEN